VYEQSFIDAASWEPGTYDLVLTKGVLIHLDEEQLPAAYRALYEASSQYILICEYFAPKREMVTYQDQAGICIAGLHFQKRIHLDAENLFDTQGHFR
jgi:hypothetical protein